VHHRVANLSVANLSNENNLRSKAISPNNTEVGNKTYQTLAYVS